MVAKDEAGIRRLFSPQALKDIFGDQASSFDFTSLQQEAETGIRYYDIFVNDRFVIHQKVELFQDTTGQIDIRFPAQVLMVQQLRFDELPLLSDKMPMDMVSDIATLIPGAQTRFDSLKGTLNIDIPRSWYESFGLHTNIAPRQRWTYGIPALSVNYRANADYRHYDDYSTKHAYLDLDGRLNIGRWRLIANGSFSYDNDNVGSRHDFDRGNIYATRVFGASKTRLKIGEIYTQSFFMDSVPLQGIEIYDDESMLSTVERSYTPVVTGIAQTPARVTVRQFGRIVFERNVQAGPFSFDDLPGLTSGADLEVTITEQSGATRTFTVPYFSTPLLLRAGRVHFHAAVGRYKSNSYDDTDNPFVAAGGIGYGLPFDTSVFAGAQLSENYQGFTAGAAANLGLLGAMSLQAEHVTYDALPGQGEDKGTRLHLQWNKRFARTNSYLSGSWRRYLSGRYLSLTDTLLRRDSENWQFSNYNGDLRDEISFALTQPLGRLGSLGLSGSVYRYEDTRSRQNVSATYSFNLKGASVSFSLQHYRTQSNSRYNDRETVCFLNISVPLSVFAGYSYANHSLNFGLQRNDDGTYTANEGVSGLFGENNRWSYALTASQQSDTESYYGSISKEAEYGRFTLSASQDDTTTSFTGALEGSIIATADGVYPARTLTGATVLLKIPDAPDAQPDQFTVSSRVGDHVLITGLNNYQVNEIAINPNSIPANVTMPVYVTRLVPADDAILQVAFSTIKGWQFVPELVDEAGERMPFGTTVRILGDGVLSGMVTVLNERARAYFSSAPKNGVIEAIWEQDGTRKACLAPYDLTNEIEQKTSSRAIRKIVTCIDINHLRDELSQ